MIATIIYFIGSYILLLVIRPFCFVLECLVRTTQITVNFWRILIGALQDERLLGCSRTPVKNESAEELQLRHLRQVFDLFADLEDRTNGDPAISISSCLKWFGQAGLKRSIFSKSSMAAYFTEISGPQKALNIKGFEEFISLLCEKSKGWTFSEIIACLIACETPDKKDYSIYQKKSPKKHGHQNSEFSDTFFECHHQHVEFITDTRFNVADLWEAIYSYLHQIGFAAASGVTVSKRHILHWFHQAGILGQHISLSRFLQCYQDIAMKHPLMEINEVGMLISYVARELSTTPEAIMTMLLQCIKSNSQVAEYISEDSDSGPQHISQEAVDSSNIARNNGLIYYPFSCNEEVPIKFTSIKARNFASVFKKYSKLNNPRSTGLLISKWYALLWFQDAGLLGKISPLHVLECFQQVAQKDTVVNREGFEEVVNLVSCKYSRRDLLLSLIYCCKPDHRTAKQKIAELMSRCLRETHLTSELGQKVE